MITGETNENIECIIGNYVRRRKIQEDRWFTRKTLSIIQLLNPRLQYFWLKYVAAVVIRLLQETEMVLEGIHILRKNRLTIMALQYDVAQILVCANVQVVI